MTANDSIKDEVHPGHREFHINAYLHELHQAGYSEVTLGKKRRVLRAFSRWMQGKSVLLEQLDESDIAAFVKSVPGGPASCIQFTVRTRNTRLAAIHAFFRFVAITEPSVPANSCDPDQTM